MKKHLPLILSAVACLLAAVCLWRIVLLEQAVEEQISELRTLDSSVVDLQSLPGQVQDALDRSASLLVDKNQSFGKLNTADYTVPMTVTVTPKEQTPGVTTATLVGNGTSYPNGSPEGRQLFCAHSLPAASNCLSGPRDFYGQWHTADRNARV